MTTDRFDYLGHAKDKRISTNVRERRQRALESVSQICVKLSHDGKAMREVLFDTMPTIAEIAERVGSDMRIVGIERRRKPLSANRTRPLLLVK